MFKQPAQSQAGRSILGTSSKISKRQRNEQRNCRTIEETLTQRIRPLEGQLRKEK